MDQPKNIPLSEILKSKETINKDEDEEPKKKSREDWRKAKELEEMRKVPIFVTFCFTYFSSLYECSKFLLLFH